MGSSLPDYLGPGLTLEFLLLCKVSSLSSPCLLQPQERKSWPLVLTLNCPWSSLCTFLGGQSDC